MQSIPQLIGCRFVFWEGVVGEAYCTCKENPCICYSGWGSYFEDLDELLEEIDREIGAEAIRLGAVRHQALGVPEVWDGFTEADFLD